MTAVDQNGSISNTIDRMACEWLRFNLTNSPPTLEASGRVYDTNSTSVTSTPLFYYFPSINVNARGDAVMAFSGSSSNTHVRAFYAGLLGSDPNPSQAMNQAVRLLKDGEDTYESIDWGDYSATSLDPVDALTFWTVQEYAASHIPGTNAVWGTWIGAVSPY
jgi:hypothetical protein